MAKATFTGYSTINSVNGDGNVLHDIALIKQDLYNHFYTVKGERVMRPEYGCAIWDYIMEPFTDLIRELCVQEVTRICQSDSRVSILSINVISYENALRVETILNYIPFDTVDQFILDFEQREADAADPSQD